MKPVDTTRRHFFKFGAAAVLAATLAPLPAVAAVTVPTLWGDGVHDDTHALQALLDGTPFVVANSKAVIVAESGHLAGGKFLLTDTIYVRKNNITIDGAMLRWVAPRAEYGLVARGSNMRISNVIFDTRELGTDRPNGRFVTTASNFVPTAAGA